MKCPPCFIDGGPSSLTRIQRPFEVKTNSGTLAKASYSWIASFSRLLDSSRNVVLNRGVRAATANSARRAARSYEITGIGQSP
jgi:hypothetical protein